MKEKKLTDEELNKLITMIEYQSWAQNFFELSQAAYMLKYQKAEIERLNKVETELQNLNAKYYNEAKDLRRENAELQKQVDELKANQVIECHGMLKGCDMVKQAVKYTAKEILMGLIEKAYVNECIDLTVNEVKAWFREDYGVEVE